MCEQCCSCHPVFPSERQLLEVMFGRDPLRHGAALLRHLERDGFPAGHARFGSRRYLPAVLQWCAAYEGGALSPTARGVAIRGTPADGPERF